MSLRLLANHVIAWPERLLDRLRPLKPLDFLKAQPPSFAEILPYDAVLSLDRPTVLLTDGALGIMWALDLLPHEVLSPEELGRRTAAVAEVFGKVRDPHVTFQVIFDAEPSPDISVPEALAEPKTAAQMVLADRVQAIRDLAKQPKDRLRLMRRRAYLTMRVASGRTLAGRLRGTLSEVQETTTAFDALARKTQRLADEVEYGLLHGDIGFTVLGGTELLAFLRGTFHDLASRASAVLAPESPQATRRLGQQVLRDFVEVTPHAIGVGQDTWEVASWADQPATTYSGLWARLLEVDGPHRLVVNIRPCLDASDLDTKAALLKNASDAYGELQRSEVRATQDAIARGEGLLWVSLHLLVRSEGTQPLAVREDSAAKALASKLKTLTQVPFLLERHAAPALFLFSLPFGFSAAAGPFTGRERRVLSASLAPYLPLFGGFTGTKTPLQLMVSRGGNACWLSPFASETSPHMAVLASSGGGKSFFAQNLMGSFFALEADAKPLLFMIDKKTSYEIFARVMGEDFGARIIKPPVDYPNIFRGRLDEFRLPVIVGLLKTAVSLVSKNAQLGAVDEMLLAGAIRATFAASELDARTEYVDGALRERTIGEVKIPRLSDVVANLSPVAAAAGVPAAAAEALAAHLSPFVGHGPYAALFDREEVETFDPPTPGVSLYDIDAVADNPVVATLTTQMILSEILRQIRRPENRGRPGLLVIEEAGVLAGSSPEIVTFIQDAWKTFRKLGFACVGLTNEVDDYARKPGPREIWNVSPNKVILRMLDKDIEKALSGSLETGFPPLISDPHIGRLVGSLTKKDGAYSQGLWWADETKGTFVFHPTGYDYWCAASKPIEVETVYTVARQLEGREKPFFAAVSWLARRYPRGVRAPNGSLRQLTPAELQEIGGEP